jgi:hypothetical protein
LHDARAAFSLHLVKFVDQSSPPVGDERHGELLAAVDDDAAQRLAVDAPLTRGSITPPSRHGSVP